MRILWTVRRTWYVIAFIVVTIFSLYFHLALGLHVSTLEQRCDAIPGIYGYFYRHIFPWVDITLGSFLTSSTQLICDVILSVALFQATSAASKAVAVAASKEGGQGEARRKKASKTMVMILTLSLAFILLTMPVYGFYIYWYKDEAANMRQSPKVLADLKMVSTVTHLLWYVNSAVNFLLYCLTGSKYRTEFVNLFRCCSTKSGGGGGGGGSTTQLSTLSGSS